MGVDDPERRFLSLKVGDDPHQQCVLHHVCEVSRVERMPVIHRTAWHRDLAAVTAFAIDLRALPEIAQIPIHADANFLEHPAAARIAIISGRNPGSASAKARSISMGRARVPSALPQGDLECGRARGRP